MSTLAPGSHIYVIKDVLWTNNYQDTPYFPSRQAQYNWMTSHALGGISGTSAITGVPYTHIGDHALTIRVGTNYRTARAWTYLGIHDSRTDDSEAPEYNDKMWYYFINKVNYINNNVVELELELDVMQTFMFDYELPSAFMERMHTVTDDVGGNIIPEDLDTGEYFIRRQSRTTSRNNEQKDIFLRNNLYLCFTSTEDPGNLVTGESHLPSRISINGVPSGIGIYAVDLSATMPNSTTKSWAQLFGAFNASGHYDAIGSIWLYPKELLGLQEVSSTSGNALYIGPGVYRVISVYTNTLLHSSSRPTNFNDQFGTYTPKNAKLLTYPYTFVRLDNYNGGVADFRYEFDSSSQGETYPTLKWIIGGDFSPESKLKAIPYNYKRASTLVTDANNWGEAVEGGNLPQLAFVGDNYKMYLANTQNTRNASMTAGIASGVMGIASSLLTGNVIGAVGSGVNALTGISAQLASKEDKKAQSGTQRGQVSSVVNLVTNNNAFGFRADTMQITSFNARQLDRYFSRYGYAIKGERNPKRKQREHWTFLKTIGASIKPLPFNEGAWTRPCAMGNEDMQKINSIFDSGITFWVEPDRIGDYYGYNWDNGLIPEAQW